MVFDYNSLYSENPEALGAPSPHIQRFFENLTEYPPKPIRVLDIGCGQGRDALFIARLGHLVTGVDMSEAGIAALLADSARDGLNITGIVADICDFAPEGDFEVILIDRTLHMLAKPDRLRVLQNLLGHVCPGGQMLIEDETENLADFGGIFAADNRLWNVSTSKGTLIAHHRTG